MNGLNTSIKSRDGQSAFYKTRPDELLTTVSPIFKQKDKDRSKVKRCRKTCHGSLVGESWVALLIQTSFSGGSDDEESAGKAGGPGLIPGSGRLPGEGAWQPTPTSLPGVDPTDRVCWAASRGAASFRTGRVVRAAQSRLSRAHGKPGEPSVRARDQHWQSQGEERGLRARVDSITSPPQA